MTIKEAKIDGFSNNILKGLADTSFLYDINITGKDVKEWSVQIDEYSKGKYVRTLITMSDPFQEENRPTRFKLAAARQVLSKTSEKWSLITYSKADQTTASGTVDDTKTDYSVSSYSMAHLPLNLKKGEQKAIGALVLTEGNSIAAFSGFEGEENLKTITNYDKVYLIKAELK